MKTSTFKLLLITVVCFWSCQNAENNVCESIMIDFGKIKRIDISDRNMVTEVPLEVTDNSLLTHIEQIEIKGDKIFVYDAHRVIAFDVKGMFLYQINHKGTGPGEYTNINSFFFDGDNICLFDDNLGTLFTYDKNNVFLASEKTTELMSSLYPIDNGKFVGKKKYRGDNLHVASLAVLNKDLSLSFDVDNRHLTSGIGTFDYCSTYDNRTLYWEFLNDTIYSLQDKSIMPLYYVDFNKYKIPIAAKKDKNVTDIIEYINSTGDKLATGVRYVQEDSSNIRFIFSLDGNINYVRYNKQTKETLSYELFDSTNSFSLEYFMKYDNGKIILSAYLSSDMEDNPRLLFINEESLFGGH